jgi:hypothetical protein
MKVKCVKTHDKNVSFGVKIAFTERGEWLSGFIVYAQDSKVWRFDVIGEPPRACLRGPHRVVWGIFYHTNKIFLIKPDEDGAYTRSLLVYENRRGLYLSTFDLEFISFVEGPYHSGRVKLVAITASPADLPKSVLSWIPVHVFPGKGKG